MNRRPTLQKQNTGPSQKRFRANRRRRIAIFVDTASGWGRRLVRGIINYMEKHDAWDIDLMPDSDEQRLPRDWDGDGVIARVRTSEMARRLARLRVPIVNVSGIEIAGCNFPRVTTNVQATAKLAATHFVERGYSRFAYIGPLNHAYVARHAQAFINYAHATNADLACFDSTHLKANTSADRQLKKLAPWLRSLKGPVGLFSWSIPDAMVVLRLCRENDIAVPDELAVLAGDDDSLACRICQPTLSGLVVASEQMGYQAASRLHAMLNGQPDDGQTVALDPIEIHTRNSTNALAIKDEQLRRAMHFMRENVGRSISIDQIAQSVPINRRSLERKFRAQFGASPLEELLRLRLTKVRQFLSLTDLSVAQIADRCGFATPTYMTSVFRSELGITPLRYRGQVRAR